MTIGIVRVDSLAARTAGVLEETMMSTLSWIRSAMISGNCSVRPPQTRFSTTTFWPSTQPSSRRPWRRLSVKSTPPTTTPIRATFAAGCASAASDAARAPASEVSRKRRRSMPGWWGG